MLTVHVPEEGTVSVSETRRALEFLGTFLPNLVVLSDWTARTSMRVDDATVNMSPDGIIVVVRMPHEYDAKRVISAFANRGYNCLRLANNNYVFTSDDVEEEDEEEEEDGEEDGDE